MATTYHELISTALQVKGEIVAAIETAIARQPEIAPVLQGVFQIACCIADKLVLAMGAKTPIQGAMLGLGKAVEAFVDGLARQPEAAEAMLLMLNQYVDIVEQRIRTDVSDCKLMIHNLIQQLCTQ